MMQKAEKKMKTYLRSVERRLHLPRDVKKRVMADFTSAIESRKEAGKSDAEIYAELGTPAQVAADLNEQMKAYAYVRSPWRWVCLVLSALSGLVLCGKCGNALIMLALVLSENRSVGVIGGADGPTQIFVTRTEESILQGVTMPAIILIMSLIGWYCLGHLRGKK